MENVPRVVLENFMKDPTSEKALEDCKEVVDSFHRTSALIVLDPRVSMKDNDEFLQLMEQYFSQEFETKKKDVRPQFHFQVGATPELTELPRDHATTIEKMPEDKKPIQPEGKDPKWRFFWRAGERPPNTQYEELNMPQVIPDKFPDWEKVMNGWSNLMLGAVYVVAEMLAVGLGLEKDAFTKRMNYAPHLLAPTGSDLSKYGNINTVLAGFHYDLNFLTIHGKSKFPGLNIWLRSGEKLQVRVPDGHLLLQAGKQLEWLTGARINAGFHEVVILPDTLKAIDKAKEENRPLWRVSTTLFSHIATDEILKPLKEEWATEEVKEKYPPTKAGDQVMDELKSIKLNIGN